MWWQFLRVETVNRILSKDFAVTEALSIISIGGSFENIAYGGSRICI